MRKRKMFSTALELGAETTKGDLLFTKLLDLPIIPVRGMKIELVDLIVRVEAVSLIWLQNHEAYKKGTILCEVVKDVNETDWDDNHLIDMATILPRSGWFLSDATEDSVFEFLGTHDLAALIPPQWTLLRAK